MKEDKVHYSAKRIIEKDALYNLIYGEKSGGKSYQIKHLRAVEKYLKTGKRFILLRRYKDEITQEKAEIYFKDVDVERLTDGKYNLITVYRKGIYFAKYDAETYKTTRGEKIGYTMSLSQEQNYSGCSFLDVEDIIFEEFMSRTMYLPNEPEKLQILYDTVDRKRGVVKLWLLGNTISRVCPYIRAWGLESIFKKQEKGDIDVIEIKNEETTVRLAIEKTDSKQANFSIGRAGGMIAKGEWMADPQPHIDFSIKMCKPILRIVFCFKGFTYLATLYLKKEKLFWHVVDKKTPIKPKTIVISDIVQENPYYNRNVYDMDFRLNKKVRDLIARTFTESNIFYSTDLTGTEFRQVIDFTLRR